MKIICIKEFRDKTTAININDQTKILVGDVIDCESELAKDRIAKGLCKAYKEPTKKKGVKE